MNLGGLNKKDRASVSVNTRLMFSLNQTLKDPWKCLSECEALLQPELVVSYFISMCPHTFLDKLRRSLAYFSSMDALK